MITNTPRVGSSPKKRNRAGRDREAWPTGAVRSHCRDGKLDVSSNREEAGL
jgi:hypothetical protein